MSGVRAIWMSGIFALAVLVLSISVGAMPISPLQLLAIIGSRLGMALPWTFEETQAVVLFHIRMPRALLGFLVGAGLSVSGALMQGLFRNPLAAPGLIGISSGSALAAVAVIFTGTAVFAVGGLPAFPALLSLSAFAGGFAVTVIVYRLATRSGRTNVATMLLAGVAVNALAGAGTGLFTYLADDGRLRDIIFWTLGSLSGADWLQVGIAAVCILLPVVWAVRLASALNAMVLGEADAYHLGVSVERVKRTVILLTAIAVGVSVAFCGIIGFVGLIVPHIFRIVAGPDNRYLIPGSALLGAALLGLADVASRTVISPAELPIGLLTAIAGAPFFLWLLLRDRRRLSYF